MWKFDTNSHRTCLILAIKLHWYVFAECQVKSEENCFAIMDEVKAVTVSSAPSSPLSSVTFKDEK